ncbi:hypothetical protein HDU67_008748 [Dinochytrium kinnereticum]|nr:hypothetical protein HDU67_008748 [Dinochytrium kinnereticum]
MSEDGRVANATSLFAGCSIPIAASRRTTLVLLVIISFIVWASVSGLLNQESPTYHEPRKDINDTIDCTESRIIYPKANKSIDIIKTINTLKIHVEGQGFAAITFKTSAITPYIQIATHFHANERHEKFLSVIYEEEWVQEKLISFLNITTPPNNAHVEGCTVATIIVTLPTIFFDGLNVFVKGENVAFVGDFAIGKLGSFEVQSKSLLLELRNTHIVKRLCIETESGSIRIKYVRAGTVLLNLNRASADMDEFYINDALIYTTYGNVLMLSVTILKGMQVFSDYGAFLFKNFYLGGRLEANALNGNIYVESIRGPFSLIDLKVANEHMSITDLDASTSAINSEILLTSTSGHIDANITGYYGKILMESSEGRVSGAGSHLQWFYQIPRKAKGKRTTGVSSPAEHDFIATSDNGNIAVFFE